MPGKRIRGEVKIEETISISQKEISQYFSCMYKKSSLENLNVKYE
jgi:hypothetical protein